MGYRIEFDKVRLGYAETLIDDFSFSISNPGFYTLYGRNGCGKSTLMKAINNKIGILKGEINIYEDNVKVDNKIFSSYLPADPLVFDNLTVFENLSIICKDLNKIDEILDKIGIYYLKNKLAKRCSAGEKQRIGIARVILEDKPIILLDESVCHLDDNTSNIVLTYIKELSKEKIIIFSTHYLLEAKKYSDAYLYFYEKTINVEMNLDSLNSFMPKYIPNKYNNKKLIKKCTNWSGTYIYSLFFSIVLFLIGVSVQMLTVSKGGIFYENYRYSEYDIIMKKDNNYDDNTFVTVENDLSFLESKKTYECYYVDNNLSIIKYNHPFSLGKTMSAIDPSFVNIIITDDYQNCKIDDNEILISSESFDNFKSESGYVEYDGDSEYAYFTTGAKVKVSTFDVPINQYDYIYEGRDCSSRIYINKKTFQTVLLDFFRENRHSITDNYISYKTADFSSEKLIGRDSANKEEVIMSSNFFRKSMGLPYGTDLTGYLNTKTKFSIGDETKEYTIVGFTEGTGRSVTLYDFDTMIEHFGGIDELYKYGCLTKTKMIVSSSLTKSDSIKLVNKGYVGISDLQFEFDKEISMYASFETTFCLILFSIFIVFILVAIQSIILENKIKSDTLNLLSKIKVTRKQIFKNNLYNCMVPSLIFLLTTILLEALGFYIIKQIIRRFVGKSYFFYSFRFDILIYIILVYIIYQIIRLYVMDRRMKNVRD